MNSLVPEIYDLFTYVFTCMSFHRSRVNSLCARSAVVLSEQTCIPAARLVLTAMILYSVEASGPILNVRALKMYT